MAWGSAVGAFVPPGRWASSPKRGGGCQGGVGDEELRALFMLPPRPRAVAAALQLGTSSRVFLGIQRGISGKAKRMLASEFLS